jgi:membrane protease YdiL (CAAX protease family)
MKRRITAAVIAILVTALVFGVPVSFFFLQERRDHWTIRTWIAVLIPNVMLAVVIAVSVAAVYLLATRRREPPGSPPTGDHS